MSSKLVLFSDIFKRALKDISVVLRSGKSDSLIQLQVDGNTLKLLAHSAGAVAVADLEFDGEPQEGRTISLDSTPFVPYVCSLSAEKVEIEIGDLALTVTTVTDEASFRFTVSDFFWDSLANDFSGHITVRSDVLQEICEQVSYATMKSSDCGSDIFKSAIHLVATGNKLEATTVTGQQLARITCPVVAPVPFSEDILATDFKVLVSLLKSSKQELVDLYFGGGKLGFEVRIDSGYLLVFVVSLLRLEYPQVDTILSSANTAQFIEMPAPVLLSALTKLQLVGAGSQIVTIKLGKYSSAEVSSTASSLRVELPSLDRDIVVSANLCFLLDAVKRVASGSDTVSFAFCPENNDVKSLMFVRATNDINQLHALMLYRVV